MAEVGLVNYVNRAAFETGLAVLVLSYSETPVCCLTILFSQKMNSEAQRSHVLMHSVSFIEAFGLNLLMLRR